MRHLIDDLVVLSRPVLAPFLDRAQGIYDENLNQYIKLMLRRSFGRLTVRSLLTLSSFNSPRPLLPTSPTTQIRPFPHLFRDSC